MAGKSTTLAIRITSDNQSKKGFASAGAEVDTFGSKLNKANVAAGVALGGVVALAKGSFDAASQLQQNAGAVEAVYGKYASAVEASANQAADAVGLSTSEYDKMAAVLGSQLKNAGVASDQLAGRVGGLMKQGADMSAVFGGTASDAVDALSSALKGEMDPIERYGVSLNQSAVNAQLAADGNSKLTGAALKAAQTQAILTLITKQTAAAHGQFAAQSNTAAERQQILGAQYENMKSKLGTSLLPAMTKVLIIGTKLGNWASGHTKIVTILGGTVAALAVATFAVNAASRAYSAGAKVAAAAQWIWNVAMSANPIGLVIIAIAAVVAGVIVMYKRFSWFRDFVGGIGKFVAAGFHVLKEVISWIVDKIKWFIDHLTVFGWVSKLTGHGSLFSAPAPAPAAAGVYGAAAGAAPRLYGAAGASPAGGGGTGSAGGSVDVAPVYVNITVNGALDPVQVGEQLYKIQRQYARATGRQLVGVMS